MTDWQNAPAQPIPSNPQFHDLRGKIFGRLTPFEYLGQRWRGSFWRCRCQCGAVTVAGGRNMTEGRHVSCGCRNEENHQKSKDEAYARRGAVKPRRPLYQVWLNMKNRCNDPSDKAYARYGARGIVVCDRWLSGDGRLSGYECFVVDMGPRPQRRSVERINNDGNYEPGNCRWATAREQARNRSDNITTVLNGVEIPIIAACEQLGANYRRTAERKALLLDGLSKLEELIETKDEAVSAVRTARKKLVAHGFKPKVIDFALRLRKDDDEDMIEQRRAEIEVARFLNHPIGTQPELPLDMQDRTPDVDKARAQGEIAGAEGKSRLPPYIAGTAQEQAWLDGWSTGQTTLASAFKKLEAKAPAEPGEESEDEGDED